MPVKSLQLNTMLSAACPSLGCWPWVLWVLLLFSGVRLLATPGLQHTRLPWPSLSPRVCSDSRPLSQWCHPTTLFANYLIRRADSLEKTLMLGKTEGRRRRGRQRLRVLVILTLSGHLQTWAQPQSHCGRLGSLRVSGSWLLPCDPQVYSCASPRLQQGLGHSTRQAGSAHQHSLCRKPVLVAVAEKMLFTPQI